MSRTKRFVAPGRMTPATAVVVSVENFRRTFPSLSTTTFTPITSGPAIAPNQRPLLVERR
jgi:hypothetical protein